MELNVNKILLFNKSLNRAKAGLFDISGYLHSLISRKFVPFPFILHLHKWVQGTLSEEYCFLI